MIYPYHVTWYVASWPCNLGILQWHISRTRKNVSLPRYIWECSMHEQNSFTRASRCELLSQAFPQIQTAQSWNIWIHKCWKPSGQQRLNPLSPVYVQTLTGLLSWSDGSNSMVSSPMSKPSKHLGIILKTRMLEAWVLLSKRTRCEGISLRFFRFFVELLI